jgi:hypothetical protein
MSERQVVYQQVHQALLRQKEQPLLGISFFLYSVYLHGTLKSGYFHQNFTSEEYFMKFLYSSPYLISHLKWTQGTILITKLFMYTYQSMLQMLLVDLLAAGGRSRQLAETLHGRLQVND